MAAGDRDNPVVFNVRSGLVSDEKNGKLLALNVAHYQAKYGELPLDETLAMIGMLCVKLLCYTGACVCLRSVGVRLYPAAMCSNNL